MDDTVVLQDLEKLYPSASMILLTGSAAKKTTHSKSDVDIVLFDWNVSLSFFFVQKFNSHLYDVVQYCYLVAHQIVDL